MQLQLGYGFHGHAQIGATPIPTAHGERTDALMAQLGVSYSLHDRFMLALTFPAAAIEHVHGAEGHGAAHGEEESRRGIGDPVALFRVGALADPLRIALAVGASLPAGTIGARRTGDDVAGAVIATGTTDLIMMIDVDWPLDDAFRLTGGGALRAPFYTTEERDRVGTTFNINAGVGWTFTEGWAATLGVDLLDRGKDLVKGFFAEGTGGRWVYLTPGIAFTHEAFGAFAGLQWPVYQHVNDEQLAEDFNLVAGVAWRWGEHRHSGEHDDHDHGHDDAPAFAPDVADVIVNGEAADLVPVPGKVTVFDFWAPWCTPCRDLDQRLRRIPGVAIRRANVVDWESPAARKYLADVPALPYIRVHGPDGALLFTRSGAPQTLVEDLLAVLPR